MKRVSLLFFCALIAFAFPACAQRDAHRMTFELCTINADGTLARPALLSGRDLSGVKAVSKSAWYVLSGSHTTSKIVLTIKAAKLQEWLLATKFAAQQGDRIAIVLDGKTIGTLVWMKAPEGDQLEIDASFFSSGDEGAKSDATKALARQIRAGME